MKSEPELDVVDLLQSQMEGFNPSPPGALNLDALADAASSSSAWDGVHLEKAGAARLPRARKQHTPGARNLVYQAVVDLTNQNRPASRQLIAQWTNLKLTTVDDHVKSLKDDGLLRFVVNGIVEPVEHFPPDRAISITELPSGMVKYEIGDDVLELTPSEARRTGRMMTGFAQDAKTLNNEREGRRRDGQFAQLERQLADTEKMLADLMLEKVKQRRTGRGAPDGQG